MQYICIYNLYAYKIPSSEWGCQGFFGGFSEVSGQVQHNLFEKNLFFENLGEEFSEFGGVGLDTLWDVRVVGKN